MPAPLALLRVLAPAAKNALALVGLWDKLPKDAKARVQERAQALLTAKTTRARLDVAKRTADEFVAGASSPIETAKAEAFVARAVRYRHALMLAEGLRGADGLRQRRRIKADTEKLISDMIEYSLDRESRSSSG